MLNMRFFSFFFQAEDGIRDFHVTGVQTCALPISLGAEMLRNVESFWCPIRFASGKKCDNCKLDFPDIEAGWVGPEGTMGDVVATLERMYAAPATANLPTDQRHPWFGHTVRTTAGGAE